MAKGITVPVVQSGLEASIEAAAKKAGPLNLSATVDPSSFKRLSQPLGRVSGLATEFEKSIAASNARVIAFGASVGIINGVQNAFASLVKTTIEVEKSLANIAVISGKTTDQLQPFSRALFEIAKNTAQSFQTASEAALEFSRQGLSLEETLKRTQDALTLTRFTSLSAAEAVDVLTAAANSFGATGITTSEILNKLVAVDTKFAVSAEDLAKGLSRAGSIAQEVGVNFDELNAIVTIAQERTARGGAVIGNAFKTIFSRIRSEETIQALQSIGIYSFDAEGRLKPVVSLLEELAGKINTLDETKKIEVLEAIASKYNINVLTALVDDLSSTASKFREARDVSSGAQSEAYQRQIELNKTLDAVISRVTNSAAQLADTLGKIGVTDSLKSLLNFFDSILTGINDVVDSEGIGGTIAKGLISGISGVFFKIGIPLLLAIFVKLTKDIAQFGTESLKTILGINKEVRERQALEQAVVNTLIKDQQVMASILSLSGDRRKQEEYLLGVYNRQLAALQQVQSIASTVAPALQAAGLSATSGTVKKRAAEGYLPAQEAADVRRGVGGADKSAKVVKIPNFSFGDGKKGTMYANTSEYIVPNYNGGDGSAIFNKDMVRKYGMPENAKKINAATGYIPNFVEESPKYSTAKEKELAKKKERRENYNNRVASSFGIAALLVKSEAEQREVESETAYGKMPKTDANFNQFSRVKFPVYGLKQSGLDQAKLGLLPEIEEPLRRAAFDVGLAASSQISGRQVAPEEYKTSFKKSLGGAGAFGGTIGSIFESAARTAFKFENSPDNTLDVPVVSDSVRTAFGITGGERSADLKGSVSDGVLRRFADQVINNGLIRDETPNVKQAIASKGYIPNFAKEKGIGGLAGKVIEILAGRVFESLVKDSDTVDLYENAARPDIDLNPEERSKEIKLSLDAAAKDDRVGKKVSQGGKGFTVVVPQNAQNEPSAVKKLQDKKVKIQRWPIRREKAFEGARKLLEIYENVDRSKIGNPLPLPGKQKGKRNDVTAVKGYIPNYAETLSEMYDWDGTIIPRMAGKPEEYIQSLQKLEKKDLLPIGKELASSKEKFDIATARPILFREPIKQTAQRLGLNVERIFPLGSMFENRRTMGVKGKPRKLYGPERKALFAEKTNRSIVDNQEDVLAALGSRGIDANLRNRGAFGFIPNFASQNAIDAMRRIISDPAAPQGEKDAASLKLSQLTKVSSLNNPRVAAQKTTKIKVPITQEDKDYLNQNKEKIVAGMGRSFGMLFNLDALEMGDLGYVKRLDPIVAKKLSEIAQKQGGRDSIRSLVDFGSAARGYIPNFAENEPLKEAISREMGAGVPAARVRVTQDGRLKNPKNPNGLAVINTRDEPNGKIPNDFRERGMRAAMASRGFVPNFADEDTSINVGGVFGMGSNKVDLSGIQTATTELLAKLKNSTIESDQFNTELESLTRAFNDLKTKALKDLKNKTENAGDATKKYSDAVQQKAKAIQAQKTAPTTGGGATGGDVAGRGKGLDIGKFLVLQTAVVGLTSAIQSATEQGSAAANALEGISAIGSGLATFVAIGTSLSPQFRILAAAATALASAFPLLSRLYEDFKDPAQRAAEALSKLAKEAEKTGRKISPEEFLAIFEEQDKIKKAEEKKKSATQQIQESLSKQGLGAGTETLQQLYAIANTLDLISKDGIVQQAELQKIIRTSQKALPVRGGAPGLGFVSTETGIDIGATIQSAREKVTEKRLADARKPQTEDRTVKTVKAENELLKIKFDILNSIVKKELEINNVYANRIRSINSENTALERSKTILLETKFSELQASQERRKIRAEEAKAISENANNLRSSLAGLQDQGLGNIFGEADTGKLQGLLEAFKTGGVGSEAFGKAFQAATARVGQDGKPIAGTNIAQLSSATQQDVYKNLNEAANNEARARNNAVNRVRDIDQAQKDFQSSTQLLINETNLLNAIISGTPVLVGKLNQTFSGAAKYEEILGGERAKLSNSLSKAALQNKISIDLAEENYASEVGLLALRINLEEELRKRVPIEARVRKDAMELNRATSERIDQLGRDARNAGPRLKAQRDILDAESLVIESENAINEGNIDLANVTSLRKSTLAKLIQSEKKAEEETLASVQIIGKKIGANRAALVRETGLINAENNYYNIVERLADISALRESTLAKLNQSERQAEIQNQAAIETASEKYDTDLNAIRRQAELTEAQNRAAENTNQLNAVVIGLRLARAKLVESERKAEEENQIAIRMIGQSYQADIDSTKRKIEYAQALIGQIDAAKVNEKVTGEMTLEALNLINSLREAQAKFNNIDDIEVGNEALRTRTNILGETTSTISRGLALSNLGIGGELEAQAFAKVAEQRRAGRKAEDISASELYDISKGRNLSIRQGLSIQKSALLDEAQTFQDIIGKSTPKLFADGMAEAMQAALNQADDLGGALRNVALTFLKNLQSAFLQSASRQIVSSILPNAVPGMKEGGYVKGYASGGLVTGGSGYKDDVPAMLSEGEYVIRKSSVNKYGASNLQKLNSGEAPKFADGGIFLPGVRGQGQISGYKDLTAFAKQTTTSGATDVLAGGATTAFASLEDQSSRLSAYALMNEDDTINQEIRSAQEQAMNIMAEREAYRTAERKAFQKQLIGTVASAALSFGVGKLGSMFTTKTPAAIPNLGFDAAKASSNIGQVALPTPSMLSAPITTPSIRTPSTSFGDFMSPARIQTPNYGSVLSMFQPQMQSPVLMGSSIFSAPRAPGRAYGGIVKRYNTGGPTDDIPALLMGGEYVMNRQATKKYGRQFFDSINQGRAPRFADGGNVSTAEPSFAEKAASSSDSKATGATNVSININVTSGTSDTQTQGDTKQGGVDYKKMSEQIKQVVIQTINEEKRLGGSLRPRN
jgi:TP901 family phage tail tape measure protein